MEVDRGVQDSSQAISPRVAPSTSALPLALPRARAGRVAPPADEYWVAAARRAAPTLMEAGCGPYRWLGVESARPLLTDCRRIVARVESDYVEIFRLELTGSARGAILAFPTRAALGDFAASVGSGPGAGYAGFTRPARGIVALYAGGDRAALAATLTHELAHLLHRRALGPDLGIAAPWLSEGLADALADTVPDAAHARRLWQARSGGRADSVGTVLRRRRSDFDRGPARFDYETSALLVRFLLMDADLGPRFIRALRDLAGRVPYHPDRFLETLGVGAAELDRRFGLWLDRQAQ